MTSQLNQYPDDDQEMRPTLYEAFLWSNVNDPATPLSEQFKANMKAHLIACGSTAVLEAVLQPYEEDLDALGGEAYEQHFQQVVSHILEEAERTTLCFTPGEDQAITQFESEKQREGLRRDILTTSEIDSALCHFGERGYLEARPDVERLLTSHDPNLRARALEVLILHWGLSEYKKTAFQFLVDPDPDCRKQGMRCLNPNGNVLDDLPVLQAYARIAANPAEIAGVRLSAYGELLMATDSALDDDRWQDIEAVLEDGGKLEQAPWIDWKLIHSFRQEH